MSSALRCIALALPLLCATCSKTSSNTAKLPGKIMSELTNAENMVKSQLRGNPKIMDEELKLLHGAEVAAKSNDKIEATKPPATHGMQLLEQQAGFSNDERLLAMAKTQAEQLLNGHPADLQKAELAMNQAMSAIHSLSKPSVALTETKVSQTENLSKSGTSFAMLEQQRSNTMVAALQEQRSYAVAEDKLATEGGQILSQFAGVKDAIAQAFAGKNSEGVKTAMAAGEMLDGAREKQQEMVEFNRAEAAKAKHEVATEQAAFAQVSAESRQMQEQQAYTSGMDRLATDGKAILGEFSNLKSAVAQAFAGKDSKAVEHAMEVGELLDEARLKQQDVTKRDEVEVSSARELFKQASKRTSLVQKQGSNLLATYHASHAMRLQRLAVDERRTLAKTKRVAFSHLFMAKTKAAEDAVKRLAASSSSAAADDMQREVVDALEKAQHAEEAAVASTGKVAQAAATRS